MIVVFGFGVTFLAWLVWYLIHGYGENSTYLRIYLMNIYNPLTARWHYLEEYLLIIVWIALGVTVTAVIFWCIIHAFGDNSKQ